LIDLQRLEKGSEKSKTQKPLASNSKLLLLKYVELIAVPHETIIYFE
jgi:hypothetical protein